MVLGERHRVSHPTMGKEISVQNSGMDFHQTRIQQQPVVIMEEQVGCVSISNGKKLTVDTKRQWD